MKDEIVPIATIGNLLATVVLGVLGDALILMIAPHPITATDHVWWALIFAALVHRLGPWSFSHYRHLTGLASWPNIHDWAIRYPGLWGWIEFAKWWWVVAVVVTLSITFWLVWRRPNQPDQHLRGTHLADDIKTYRRLRQELEQEE